MNFNISHIHSIFENSANNASSKVNDETGANLDNTLGSNDLMKVFDSVCPITGQVFAALKDAAANPDNLKVVVTKKDSTTDIKEDYSLYIEASEFYNFMEAAGLGIQEAAEAILEHYSEEIPDLGNAGFHVVFPNDMEKNYLGCENYGTDIKNDWPMKLMSGCRRYGLKVNSGVEADPESVTVSKHVEMEEPEI